jgi:hypothetical protein
VACEEADLRRPAMIELLRLWILENGALAGLIGAITVLAAVGGVAMVFTFFQPRVVTHTTGTIVRLGPIDVERGGTSEEAFVEAEDREVPLRLPVPNSCQSGGPIRLIAQRLPWDLSISPEWTPCAPLPPN